MPVRNSGRVSSSRVAGAGEVVGRRIAGLRAKRRISLRGLAEKSGVSSSMICDIENGTKSPTIAVLSAIAESLGLRLSDLVAESDAPSKTVAIRRRNDAQRLVDAQGMVRRQLAPEVAGGSTEIVEIAIPAHKETGTLPPHAAGTTEYVHLVQGSLRVRVGNRGYDLKTGDSIGFQADVRHAYSNTGSSRAILYVVIERAK